MMRPEPPLPHPQPDDQPFVIGPPKWLVGLALGAAYFSVWGFFLALALHL